MGMKKRRILTLAVLLGLTLAGGTIAVAIELPSLPHDDEVIESEIQSESLALSGEASGELAVELLGDSVDLLADLSASQDRVETFAPVTFDASGSSVQSGSIALYAWDLDGDGETDEWTAEPNLTHEYPEDGVYAVRLRVTDDLGNEAASDILEVTVSNRPPLSRFSVPAEVSTVSTNAEPIAFHDSSSDLDGSIVSWVWNFGDGATSKEQDPTHAYVSRGEYTATLIVTDDDGAQSAVFSRTVTVENALPKASFAGPASGIVGVLLTFFDESSDPSLNGRIVHVAWDFGDGTFLAGGPREDGQYTHAYAALGDYTVTLFVIDEDGGLTSMRRGLSVIGGV